MVNNLLISNPDWTVWVYLNIVSTAAISKLDKLLFCGCARNLPSKQDRHHFFDARRFGFCFVDGCMKLAPVQRNEQRLDLLQLRPGLR